MTKLLLLVVVLLSACGPQNACDQCRADCPFGTVVSQCDPNATPDDGEACRCAEG